MIKPLNFFTLSVIFIIIIVLSSCENNIEVIKGLGHAKELPSAAATEIEILYSDSAKVKMKIVAQTLNKFNLPDKQYIEFPKGITVYQYDTALQVESMVRCNFAIYHEITKIWEARSDVVVKNLLKNEQLNTEELFWDQEKGTIYSNKFTKLTNADGVFVGDKFQSKDDLSKWELLSVKGKVNIKDIPNETETP